MTQKLQNNEHCEESERIDAADEAVDSEFDIDDLAIMPGPETALFFN